MLIAAFSAALLAQASPAELTEPPKLRKAAQCACGDDAPTDYITLRGLVVDAEVTLAPSGRAVNDRQATIFDIVEASGGDAAGRTRVWHLTDPDRCGVAFDYGLSYTLAARRTDEGDLETDACLMRAVNAR